MDYKSSLRDYYSSKADEYASSYTGQGRYRSNHFRLLSTLRLVEALQPRPERALEAGCGDARVVEAMLEQGYDCEGFDFSEEMLVKARARLGDAAHRLRSGDIYEIPFPDADFDLVLCLGVLANLPDQSRIYQQFRRVLRPGGRVILSLNNELFSLFSMNRYTRQFFADLFAEMGLPEKARERFQAELSVPDPVPIKHAMEDSEIDTSPVQLEKHNPLTVKERFLREGFTLEKIRYYHYHPLPPHFEAEFPELFADFAEGLETAAYDWKGALLCNAMILQLRRD